MTVFPIENYAQDSRVKLTEDGIVQTLNARMGTGGGNVPMVLMTNEAEAREPTDCYAIEGNGIRPSHRGGVLRNE